MKETIIHCDICGSTRCFPGVIDFRTFSGEPVLLFLACKNKELHETVQMDICPRCARKIKEFLENMEREKNND